MRSFAHTFIALALVFGLVVSVNAGDADKAAEAKADTTVVLVNQTHCPVMGGKIDSTVYTDIQGQRVYHCCPGCSPELIKNPDKYFKKAAAEGVLFENIQTICPVSGKEIEEKVVYADYEGRRVYFCCEGCPDKFMDNPEKFLKQMDEASADKSDDTMEHGHDHDHGDHKH